MNDFDHVADSRPLSHESLDNSQEWAALGLDYGAGHNAFTAVVPRGTDADRPAVAPQKRGPRPDGPLTAAQARELKNERAREYERKKRIAAKTAKLLAYSPFNSHNFAPKPVASKTVKVAGSRFASA